ncbi:hypothetical protein SGRI78S_03327 [Streptomyces griseus subsp. griseus]
MRTSLPWAPSTTGRASVVAPAGSRTTGSADGAPPRATRISYVPSPLSTVTTTQPAANRGLRYPAGTVRVLLKAGSSMPIRTTSVPPSARCRV